MEVGLWSGVGTGLLDAVAGAGVGCGPLVSGGMEVGLWAGVGTGLLDAVAGAGVGCGPLVSGGMEVGLCSGVGTGLLDAVAVRSIWTTVPVRMVDQERGGRMGSREKRTTGWSPARGRSEL
jgi:hypothetical protein